MRFLRPAVHGVQDEGAFDKSSDTPGPQTTNHSAAASSKKKKPRQLICISHAQGDFSEKLLADAEIGHPSKNPSSIVASAAAFSLI
jgi:hypothetical protein